MSYSTWLDMTRHGLTWLDMSHPARATWWTSLHLLCSYSISRYLKWNLKPSACSFICFMNTVWVNAYLWRYWKWIRPGNFLALKFEERPRGYTMKQWSLRWRGRSAIQQHKPHTDTFWTRDTCRIMQASHSMRGCRGIPSVFGIYRCNHVYIPY